jgi:hypothetical protein
LTIWRSSSVRPLRVLPQRDVRVHVDFLRHPVVRAAVQVLLPGPLVLEGHELVEVGAAVDDLLVVDADALGAHFEVFEAGVAGRKLRGLGGVSVEIGLGVWVHAGGGAGGLHQRVVLLQAHAGADGGLLGGGGDGVVPVQHGGSPWWLGRQGWNRSSCGSFFSGGRKDLPPPQPLPRERGRGFGLPPARGEGASVTGRPRSRGRGSSRLWGPMIRRPGRCRCR